jgi:hypothetical protein
MLKQGLLRKPVEHPLLLDIIQQRPLQVNQYAAQSEKQEREALLNPPASLLDK